MEDYNNYTDEQLIAAYQQKKSIPPAASVMSPPTQSKPDYNNLSDEELINLHEQKKSVPRGTLGEIGHKARLAGETFAKSALGVADLFTAPNYGQYAMREVMPSASEIYEPEEQIPQTGLVRNVPESPRLTPPSQYAQQFLKDKFGLDLNTQQAETGIDRGIKHTAEFAGSLGGVKALGASYKLGRAALLGRPSLEAAKQMFTKKALMGTVKELGAAGAAGATSQAAQEMGVNPLVADIGAAVGVPAANTFVKNTNRILREGAHIQPKTPSIAPNAGASSGYVSPVPPPPSRAAPPTMQKGEEDFIRNLATQIKGNPRGKAEEEIPLILKELEDPDILPDYKQTTAESSKNTTLAQLQRTHKGLIGYLDKSGELNAAARNALSGTVAGEHNFRAVEQTFKEVAKGVDRNTKDVVKDLFAGRLNPQEAGKIIRGELNDKRFNYVTGRKYLADPLYDEARASVKLITPNGAQQELATLIKEEKEKSIRLALKEVQNLLYPNEFSQGVISKIQKQLSGLSPEAATELTNQYLTESGIISSSPKELMAADSAIKNMINGANNDKNYNLARVLKLVQSKLDKDLEVLPQYKKANQLYRILSEPIEELENHPLTEEILKLENGDFKNPLTSNIADTFLKNEEKAKHFMEITKDLPEARKGMEEFINNELLQTFVDESGEIKDFNKVSSWVEKMKKDKPGIFIAYPHLKTKLSNLQNTRVLMSSVAKKAAQNVDNHYADAFEMVANQKPFKVISNVFGSKQPDVDARALMEIAKHDSTGAAVTGLQRATIDYMIKKSTLAGKADSRGLKSLSTSEFQKFMNQRLDTLNEIFTPEQINNLRKIEDVLYNANVRVGTQGTAVNSATAANAGNFTLLDYISSNLSDSNVINSLGWATFGRPYHIAKAIIQLVRKSKAQMEKESANEILKRFMVDKDYAKLLLTKVKDLNDTKESTINSIFKKAYMRSHTIPTEGETAATARPELSQDAYSIKPGIIYAAASQKREKKTK